MQLTVNLSNIVQTLMSKTVNAGWEAVEPTSGNSANGATKTLQQAIQEAIEQARATCEMKGDNSSDCAVAWDIVEELQAECSHRKIPQKLNSLQQYCLEHPEAVECLIYDV